MDVKWLVLLVVAGSVFGMTCLYRAVKIGRCRMICVNGNVFDWGVVDEGASVEHDFLIKNEGRSDLIIKSVNPGCGCTKAEISSRTLGHNETATLRITYTARRVSPEYIRAVVVSNDKRSPVQEFVVKGSVKFALKCRPQSLSFDLSGGAAASFQTLHFETNMGALELSKCSGADSFVLEWDQKEREYVCSVKPKPGFNGPTNQEMVVEFRIDGNTRNIRVPVYVLH
jgi:hypothetical protein